MPNLLVLGLNNLFYLFVVNPYCNILYWSNGNCLFIMTDLRIGLYSVRFRSLMYFCTSVMWCCYREVVMVVCFWPLMNFFCKSRSEFLWTSSDEHQISNFVKHLQSRYICGLTEACSNAVMHRADLPTCHCSNKQQPKASFCHSGKPDLSGFHQVNRWPKSS